MTEEEARGKLCCMSMANNHLPRQCRASDCMAWRLISRLAPDDGYCGLAGTPRHLQYFAERREDDD